MTIDEITYILTEVANKGIEVGDAELLFSTSYYDIMEDSDVERIFTIHDEVDHNEVNHVYLVHEGLKYILSLGTYHYQDLRLIRRLVVREYHPDRGVYFLGNEVREVGYSSGFLKWDNSGIDFWNTNLYKYENLQKLRNKL
jgi:hypothetical protein